MDFWQLNEEELEPHAPRVLHSEEGASRVILLGLPEGELLQEHEVREHALLFLLEGALAVSRCFDCNACSSFAASLLPLPAAWASA